MGCEQRLDVTGFRLPGQPADSYLWETWQYNDLDELQSWAHTTRSLWRGRICVRDESRSIRIIRW
jgi:hypothetical protein